MRFHAYLFAMLSVLLLAGPARAGTDQWTTNGPYGGQVRVLATDPENSSTIYAADTGGVFKSVDGGASWTRASAGITDLAIKAVVVDPQDGNTLYAGTDQGGGVFKSTDGGASWTALHSAPGVVNGLALDPKTPTTIYAAEEQSGLFKSTDGGASFTNSSNGLPSFGTYVAIVVDPTTTSTLYAAERTNGIFKSTDGGASWAAANSGITGSLINPQALVIDPQTPATLYAVVDAGTGKLGLYKSTNGAASWSLASTLGTDDGNGALAINPQTPSTLYAGGFGLGTLQSTDGGASFSPVKNGLSNLNVLALAVNPQGTVYAGTQAGIFVSSNAGAAWWQQNAGLALAPVRSVLVDPATPTTLYAATSVSGATAIFKSTDGGDSWAESDSGLTPNSITAELTVFVIDPVTSTTLYAGGEGGFGLFKSTNGGASWTEIDGGFPQGSFTSLADLAIDPQTSSTLYAGTQSSGVYKSTDGGATWNAADTGLTAGANENIVNLSIVGAPAPQLFVSTLADGLFASADGAGSWTQIDIALPAETAAHRPLVAVPPCQSTYNRVVALGGTGYPQTKDLWQVYLSCRQAQFRQGELGLVVLFNAPVSAAPVRSAANAPTAAIWGETDGAYTTDCGQVNAFAGDPLDPTHVFAGADCGVLQVTNSGAQVVSMSLGLPPGLPVNALGITSSASDLYAGTNSGVYRFSVVDSPLAAAVVPSSRSAEVGSTVTAFATLINTSTSTASGCSLAPSTDLPASFFYQTTAPGTNAPTGSPNTPVDIAAGGAQSFVFGLAPNAAFDPIDAQFEFSCSGLAPVAVLPGINTLLVSGSADPVPDVVAILATASNDGILHLPGSSGSNAFAGATINLGAADTITVSATLGAPIPVALALCQTDPTSGACLAPAGPSVSTTVAAGATPTFAFFAAAGGAVPLDPVNNRIFVQFTDSTGLIRGSSSVAVETQ